MATEQRCSGMGLYTIIGKEDGSKYAHAICFSEIWRTRRGLVNDMRLERIRISREPFSAYIIDRVAKHMQFFGQDGHLLGELLDGGLELAFGGFAGHGVLIESDRPGRRGSC